MDLLSDRHRVRLVAACAIGCLCLMTWWMRELDAGDIGAIGVLDRPEGTQVVLSLLRVLEIDGDDAYVVGHAALRVPVHGSSVGLVVGQEITVRGRVAGDHVRAEAVEQAPGRPAKFRLGLLGLAGGAALFASAVSWTPRGLALRG